ncbi:glycosyltransferase family 2 protein [Rhodoluna limnophila]|uniref:glycosyltransferase family 2 protein n=1 Tax=Rhodoluna limnophila TaxID=232537 RepID=UPI001106DA8A|nr:glycosyltransferase [Rhodoluna limnophila]
MEKNPQEPTQPYAPMPASVVKTRLRLGSWFQQHPTVGKFVSIVALGAGSFYLWWRLVFTLPDANPFFFWPLFLAEAFGFVTFLILVVEAWEIPLTPRLPPLDLAVDIIIATYDEDIDIILPTVIGALQVRGRTTIWLCDDGRREEMRLLAEKYGINYQVRDNNRYAKAGNINAVLPKLKGDLILVLDADHVPSPDFLEATTGYFSDPKLALVQTAHSFRNHNSVMHEEVGRHEQSLFFDVLLPGRNRLKSVFWCGSAGLIRRAALVSVGGMAIATSTEDFETSLSLQVAGYEIKYHNEHLVQGLAPDNLEAYTIQRFRWAQGTIGSYRKGGRKAWSPKLSFAQRFSYTGGLIYHVTPLQRLAYTVSILAVTLFAIQPVGYAGEYYLYFWGAWVLLSMLAVSALERGVTQPLEGIRNHLIVFEAFLNALPSMFSNKEMPFVVTPKNEVDLGGWRSVKLLRLPIIITSITLLALLIRWVDLYLTAVTGQGFLTPITATGIIVASIFGVVEAAIVFSMTARVYNRRQYRKLWRFPVSLAAKVAGDKAKCIDLHHAGAGVIVAKSTVDDLAIAEGSRVPFTIQCRTTEGSSILARGVLAVSNVRPYSEAGATVRLGGPVEWNTDTDRDAVVEHCYVVEPYVARNQAWARRAPRVPVSLSANLAELPANCIDLSIYGAAFMCETDAWAVGEIVPVSLTLEDGLVVRGNLEVKNVILGEDEWFRIGGTTQWAETSWLHRYTTLAMVPASRNRSVLPPV